jgi:very-short-patch-repair endonuclease
VHNKHYRGPLVGLKRKGCEQILWLTPSHLVAVPLPQLPSFKAKLETAQLLRRKSTKSEDILWQALRNGGLEHKFRRQHILGPFVADFYCPALRLVIEIDGTIHETTDQKAYDEFRQRIIEQCEIAFLRVSSRETEKRPAKVIRRIASVVEPRKQQMSYGVRWLAAGNLKSGDRVCCKGNTQYRTIESNEYIEVVEPLYNLTIEADNSYVSSVCTIHS